MSEATELPWMEQDPLKGDMTLHYNRLAAGYFVGGKTPRTSRCPTCGQTALRTQYHFVHRGLVALDTKNNPKMTNVVFCPVPAALTDAQRRAMVALRDGLTVEVEKSTTESLEKRGLVTRVGRLPAELSKAGRLLLEEGW